MDKKEIIIKENNVLDEYIQKTNLLFDKAISKLDIKIKKKKVKKDKKYIENILKKYKLTMEHYEQMKREQNNKCYMSGEAPEEGKVLCIDHDHKTNKVRKLLCVRCNILLGRYKDNIKMMEEKINLIKKAILYLTEHQKII